MTTKHTPGPWEATKSLNFAGTFVAYIGPTKKDCIAQTRGTVREVDEANATLLAAAPKLLEACELALSYMESTYSNVADDVLESLEDAIAQAKGGKNVETP